jgi:hypothetical protein
MTSMGEIYLFTIFPPIRNLYKCVFHAGERRRLEEAPQDPGYGGAAGGCILQVRRGHVHEYQRPHRHPGVPGTEYWSSHDGGEVNGIRDGRCGEVVGILAYYARGRGFDSRTVQTFVWMNMSVCIGSGCFYIICMYLQKKSTYLSMYIYSLRTIHNTSHVSAYFGLDSRECRVKFWRLSLHD